MGNFVCQNPPTSKARNEPPKGASRVISKYNKFLGGDMIQKIKATNILKAISLIVKIT